MGFCGLCANHGLLPSKRGAKNRDGTEQEPRCYGVLKEQVRDELDAEHNSWSRLFTPSTQGPEYSLNLIWPRLQPTEL